MTTENWHWTNDDHTEARRGKWKVQRIFEFGQHKHDVTTHDDFPGYKSISFRPGDTTLHDGLNRAYEDFLAWTRLPKEPTGLGAVVEVNGYRYAHVGGGYWTRWQGVNVVKWDQVVNQGTITVLSEGVQS